jgi:release factor glutamine methyltransferase
MGTGSGIQAKAAKSKGLNVTAVDINPHCMQSLPKDIRFIQSDLFSNIDGEYDTIIFNPPYLPDEIGELALDGGPTGREILDKFLSDAKAYLAPRGQLLFIQSSITGTDKTKQHLVELGYEWEILSSQRIFFEELVVFRAWLR